MKLLLIRHADPDYEADSITPLGHIQAKQLSLALSRMQLSEIYVSPFGRAQETMEYTTQAKNMVGKMLPWLAELNGNYRDNLWAWDSHGVDIKGSYLDISLDNWHKTVDYGLHLLPIIQELYGSFDKFLVTRGYLREGGMYKVTSVSNKTIAFFCHAGVTLTLLSYLLNIPLPICYSQFSCDPSSITVLQTQEKDSLAVFKLLRLNDTSHCSKDMELSLTHSSEMEIY